MRPVWPAICLQFGLQSERPVFDHSQQQQQLFVDQSLGKRLLHHLCAQGACLILQVCEQQWLLGDHQQFEQAAQCQTMAALSLWLQHACQRPLLASSSAVRH